MPLVSMRQIMEEAEKGGYGVGAFNMNNMEQLQAIMDAAVEMNSPVILQVSEGALKYSGMSALPAMLRAMMEDDKYRNIKVALHLDHGRDLETCKKAIDLGFTSVMYDGSLDETGKRQQSYTDNVRKTREVVEYAHSRGITVEGELGALGGTDDMAAGKIQFTDPEQAGEFVRLTGVDALAISIGTSHGAYKFAGEPKLDLDRIPKIKANVGSTLLVLHGSSSVPQEIVEIIDQFTIVRTTTDEKGERWISYKKGTPYIGEGKPKIDFEDKRFKVTELTDEQKREIVDDIASNHRLARSMGVPTEMIQRAIKSGIRKINIDTDGRLAFTQAILGSLFDDPSNFDQRKYLGAGREAIKVWVKREMEYFGCANHNDDYQPITLIGMKDRYAGQQALRLPAETVEGLPETAKGRPEKLK